jgi:threonine dehydratase
LLCPQDTDAGTRAARDLSLVFMSSFEQLRATDVLAAGERLRGHIRRTPLGRCPELSEIAGGDVYLKLENEQLTGSFKLRGAMNVLATLPASVRTRGVVAASAGNHGLGVAYAAKQVGVHATVFLPRSAPTVKRQGIRDLGATIDATQPHYDAALEAAMRFAEERGATFINPCIGDTLLAGQGTVALEIVSELPSLAALVLPVGGGGLLGGCASLLRRVAPDTRIVGAQSAHTDAMAKSLSAGRVVDVEYLETLADGLAGQIDDAALDIGMHALDEIVTPTEDEIGRAIVWLADRGQGRVEGSGAVGVAALLHEHIANLPTPAAIIVSGGNIDPARFDALRVRHLESVRN